VSQQIALLGYTPTRSPRIDSGCRSDPGSRAGDQGRSRCHRL